MKHPLDDVSVRSLRSQLAVAERRQRLERVRMQKADEAVARIVRLISVAESNAARCRKNEAGRVG